MMLMHMSISGGILIILIMALRMLAVKRLPKKVFVLLWEIAALRLLIPFDLPFQYGIASPVTEKAERAVLDVSRPASGNIDWRMVLWRRVRADGQPVKRCAMAGSRLSGGRG